MTSTSRTRRVRFAAGAVLSAAALVTLSACSFGFSTGSSSAPAAPPAASVPAAPTSVDPNSQDTDVLELELGQCITQAAGEGQVQSLETVDCAAPHVGEVYSLPQVPDGDFPGEQPLQSQAEQVCAGQEFQNYVGLDYQSSEFAITYLVPSADTWANGDREIVCILTTQDSSTLTGSQRGSGR